VLFLIVYFTQNSEPGKCGDLLIGAV